MRIQNLEALKTNLLNNKNFININGGTNIETIEEVYNPYTLNYYYIVNNKVCIEYRENLGSTRRYNKLRITRAKVNA